MSLQDRNYMHHRPGPGPGPTPIVHRPRHDPSWPGLLQALCGALLLGGLALLAHDAWRDLRDAASPPRPRPQPFATLRLPSDASGGPVDPAADRSRERSLPPSPAFALAAPPTHRSVAPSATPSSRTVYKCVAGGRTTYSADGSDCAQGRRSTLVIEPGAPAVPDAPAPAGSLPPGADPRRAAFAADAPMRRQQEEAARLHAAQAAAEVERQQLALRQSQCLALERRVEHLDALARQPQSGPMQDGLRVQREQARSAQAALHC